MSQIEVSKIVPYVALNAPSGSASVSKLMLYVIAFPGEGTDTSNRQGHVHTQVIRRG